MERSAILDAIYHGMPPKPDGTVEAAHFFGAGVYVRRQSIKAGQTIRMHVHTYDHITVVMGFGRMLTDDEDIAVIPGQVIEVKAGKRHAFEASTDTLWFCIHPSDEEEARRLYAS